MGSLRNGENNDDEYTLDEIEQEQANLSRQTKKLLLSLPQVNGWRTRHLYLIEGFWCQPQQIQAALLARAHFRAQPSDVVVASIPKSGTTWLKALVFAITRRAHHSPAKSNSDHPLLANNPHELVPFLEYKVFAGPADRAGPTLDGLGSPRLVATHVPFSGLPDSVHTSPCKIVYICRNPLDTFVSAWHFLKKARPESLGPFTMEEAFEMYCKGEIGFGPYWDHMLSYWRESLREPDKVMFLKYEDMKEDTDFVLIKKLAEFLGYEFSAREEKDGVVEEVVKLCSFETLKGLEVNKSGNSIDIQLQNKNLFRKGEVGDWTNYLTKEMVERLSKVMDEKLAGSGLEFMMSSS